MKFKKLAAVLAALMVFALPLSVFASEAEPEEGEEGSGQVTGVEVEPGYDYSRFKSAGITLNVYNWGEYMSLGLDEGSMDVNAEFEALTGIKVNYTNYDTNEAMYAKLSSGAASYDIIIPSDYMIGRMINEDMLAPLNFDNIPNYSMIGDAYKGRDYDPANQYSVPYMWGYVGIIYNKTMITEPVDSWAILWDEKYENDILMFDNSRDAYAIASKLIGNSMNPTTKEEIDQATKKLSEQKGVVQAYVMDQIFGKMEGGEAAVAPYYAGDAITMMDTNPDLAFAVPKEGTNYFVDALCIPKSSTNKEAAEMYINFLCETQVSAANSEYIGYSTPQLEAQAALPEELRNNPIAYPSEEILANTETFNVLPDELGSYMDTSWTNMRSQTASGNGWVFPVILLAAVAIIVVTVLQRRIKKKKNSY
ncbi:MAG: PotD/PotF family extracellular solute-binding protein [Oscillospiraceae bacterium]